MKKLGKYFLYGWMCMLLGMALGGLYLFYVEFDRQLTEQKVRGKCIAYYVSLGIERRDIETDGARCWVKSGSQDLG